MFRDQRTVRSGSRSSLIADAKSSAPRREQLRDATREFAALLGNRALCIDTLIIGDQACRTRCSELVLVVHAAGAVTRDVWIELQIFKDPTRARSLWWCGNIHINDPGLIDDPVTDKPPVTRQ